MREIHFNGFDELPGPQGLKAKRLVYEHVQKSDFPHYAPLTVEVRRYRDWGWGYLYAVHARLEHVGSGDGLNRRLTKSLREALKGIEKALALKSEPRFEHVEVAP